MPGHGLQPDADLIHRDVADVLALLVHVTVAVSCPAPGRPCRWSGTPRVAIGGLEELAAFTAPLKTAMVSSYSSADAIPANISRVVTNISAETFDFMIISLVLAVYSRRQTHTIVATHRFGTRVAACPF
jgi:hypothetical protein